MISIRRVVEFAIALSVVALAFKLRPRRSRRTKKPYEPVPGQPGKDSVWVPTPFITLEKMYDIAKLTPKDFVMDLGSGDGRAIIVAAKRGTPGLGIEWNQDLVDLSNKLAAQSRRFAAREVRARRHVRRRSFEGLGARPVHAAGPTRQAHPEIPRA